MEKSVIVVRVPETEINRLRELRDFLLESRGKGLLVIPADTEIEEMELPLGDVLVEPKRVELSAEEPVQAPNACRSHDVGPLGRNTSEKREIMERLKAYREIHGLGYWAEVVKASGGKLSDDQLRNMTNGTVLLPVAEWRRAARALDKLEKVRAENGNSN